MNTHGHIALIEDHHQALKLWRQKKIKHLDLVHIDAHLDFGFHPAKPIEKIVKEVRSLKELKRNLEYSLAFMHYEKDLDKQTNIGNYIYPAMEEGIVRNFYWVIPGGSKEFKQSSKFIKNIASNFTKDRRQKTELRKQISEGRARGIISTKLLGRNFIVCTLERLPNLKQEVLLDIDTDFLITDSLINSSNTKKIGKRRPWILPQDLVKVLKKKIKNPRFTIIAYSVNGGWTPMKYKHLGDEIAYYFALGKFKQRFQRNLRAAKYFNLFSSSGKREYYQNAVRLNPTYRAFDNNYGPLYLSLRRLSSAQSEFSRILSVDPQNPACLFGLGNIALERRDFKKAKEYFSPILTSRNHKLFTKVKNQSLFGLARAEFGLKNFKRAKELLVRYLAIEPLQAQSYYLLGRIYEKKKEFSKAALFYKDAIRLGLGGIEPISRLLKMTYYFKEKDAIIKYITAKYKAFKKGFLKTKRLSLKNGKKIKGLHRLQKKTAAFERRLEKIKKGGNSSNARK